MGEVIEKIDDSTIKITADVGTLYNISGLKEQLANLEKTKLTLVAGYDFRIQQLNDLIAKAKSVGVDPIKSELSPPVPVVIVPQ